MTCILMNQLNVTSYIILFSQIKVMIRARRKMGLNMQSQGVLLLMILLVKAFLYLHL